MCRRTSNNEVSVGGEDAAGSAENCRFMYASMTLQRAIVYVRPLYGHGIPSFTKGLCTLCPQNAKLAYQYVVLQLVNSKCMPVFSERDTLRSLIVVANPSVVCRLSSVTLVHPTQAVELFGIFFTIR